MAGAGAVGARGYFGLMGNLPRAVRLAQADTRVLPAPLTRSYTIYQQRAGSGAGGVARIVKHSGLQEVGQMVIARPVPMVSTAPDQSIMCCSRTSRLLALGRQAGDGALAVSHYGTLATIRTAHALLAWWSFLCR